MPERFVKTDNGQSHCVLFIRENRRRTTVRGGQRPCLINAQCISRVCACQRETSMSSVVSGVPPEVSAPHLLCPSQHSTLMSLVDRRKRVRCIRVCACQRETSMSSVARDRGGGERSPLAAPLTCELRRRFAMLVLYASPAHLPVRSRHAVSAVTADAGRRSRSWIRWVEPFSPSDRLIRLPDEQHAMRLAVVLCVDQAWPLTSPNRSATPVCHARPVRVASASACTVRPLDSPP
jgi:hypothetical protein